MLSFSWQVCIPWRFCPSSCGSQTSLHWRTWYICRVTSVGLTMNEHDGLRAAAENLVCEVDTVVGCERVEGAILRWRRTRRTPAAQGTKHCDELIAIRRVGLSHSVLRLLCGTQLCGQQHTRLRDHLGYVTEDTAARTSDTAVLRSHTAGLQNCLLCLQTTGNTHCWTQLMGGRMKLVQFQCNQHAVRQRNNRWIHVPATMQYE